MRACTETRYLLSFRQLFDADLLHVVLLVEVVKLDVPRQLQCTEKMSDIQHVAESLSWHTKHSSTGVDGQSDTKIGMEIHLVPLRQRLCLTTCRSSAFPCKGCLRDARQLQISQFTSFN